MHQNGYDALGSNFVKIRKESEGVRGLAQCWTVKNLMQCLLNKVSAGLEKCTEFDW